MKNILTIVVLLFMISAIKAQIPIPVKPTYVDPGNRIAVKAEVRAADKLQSAKNQTRNAWYLKVEPTTQMVEEGKTILGKPVKYVYFEKYDNMCEAFIGKEEELCEEKLKYLKQSHDLVFDLLSIEPLYRMRKGVKDLIWEKYASISKIIIRELEKIKLESEKEKKKRILQYLD